MRILAGLIIGILVLIAGIIWSTIYVMDTNEMYPVIHKGDWMLIDRRAYSESSPKVGEVVLIQNYRLQNLAAKRVLALPGDRIAVKDGFLMLNGRMLNEDYIYTSMNIDFDELIVPEGKVFLLNDNRNLTSDSRTLGPIDMSSIVGRIILIY